MIKARRESNGRRVADGRWDQVDEVFGLTGVPCVLQPECVLCNCPGRYSKWVREAALAERHDSTNRARLF